MKPRIVMITSPIQSIPPRNGAAVEWWMLQTAKRMQQFEPHLIALGKPDELPYEQVDGVAVHRFHFGRLYKRLFQKITRLDPWSYAHRAARLIRHLDARIVHVHNNPALCQRLRQLDKDTSRCYLLHMHNDKPLKDDTPLLVVSQYMATLFRQRQPERDITVIANGVDCERHQTRAQARHATPSPQPVKLLYAGRMSPEKGPQLLLEAFQQLLGPFPDIHLTLVGEFSHGDPANERVAYGMAVQQLIKVLSDKVTLLPAAAPEHMPAIYGEADIVAVPSTFEAFGMVALEAMASGCLVVASRRGGLPEFVLDGQTGLLVDDATSLEQWKTVLARAVHLHQAGSQLGQTAQRYSLQYDWSVIVQQLEDIYRKRAMTCMG